MGSNYKVGEKVVCIDARRRWYKLGGLRQFEIYTVVGFNPYDGGLILQEVKSLRSGYHAYAQDRFRKIDYQFAEAVMAKISPARKKIKTESLQK